ncbi:MAG: N-acetylmuramoyl-L-alanine amidase [Thermovirga sp.]|nr:N-acetylmuramoyl-L-alanine amidase [Thermovirga sp.]
MSRWRAPRITLCALAALILLPLLSPGALSAQEGWDLLRGGESLGRIPVQTVQGGRLVALDSAVRLIGLSAEGKGDTLVLKGPGGSLQIFPGAAAAIHKGEIIPLMHEVLREGGHWWVDPDCALVLFDRVAGSGGGSFAWKGEGYKPRPQSIPVPTQEVVAPQPSGASLPGPIPASSATVRSIRWGRQDFGLRVVLDLSNVTAPEIKPGPGAVTVTIPGFMARGTAGSVSPYPSEVGLSVTQFGDRVVLAFKHNASSVRHLALEGPFRQVIDFYDPRPIGTAPAPYAPWTQPPEEVIFEEEISDEPCQPLPVPVKTPGGVKTVVIDAGHGGKDPGAVANGIREKDINLRVARLMADMLKKEGLRVVLTRSTDVYLQLSQRTSIALKEDADAFVSLHCNALPKGRSAQGVEIYLMALPSDKHAMELALIENRELVGGGLESSEAVDKRTRTLLKILGDMQQNVKIQESTSFAEILYRKGGAKKLPMRRVAQAPFFVLRGAAMPSVLVEMGFITNKVEAAKLKNANYQRQIAEALSAGIVEFLGQSHYN